MRQLMATLQVPASKQAGRQAGRQTDSQFAVTTMIPRHPQRPLYNADGHDRHRHVAASYRVPYSVRTVVWKMGISRCH